MRITAFVWIALVVLLPGAAVQAQNQPSLTDYRVVLVPVFFFGPGAHGSQWETSVSLASTASPNPNPSMPVPVLADPWAPNDGCEQPTGEIEGDVRYFLCSGYASPSGLFLYIPKTLEAKELHVNARVRDLTRAASSAGTEIPVVPESEFSSEEMLLLDIPSDTRFRSNLRIYGGMMTFSEEIRFIHPGGPGSVKVDIYDSRDLNVFPPLASTSVELSVPEAVAGSPYLVHPAYFSIGDLVAAFPQLATVPSYTIRLRAGQPLADPPRELTIWAFVTITNNDTQEVTTVSP